ncbi:MAG: glycosyltransferase family 4 protein, partial [Bacteroidia bacterium]|nr:glycosyltransferase family 4 protein [Bacteroidia bacterium]
RRRVNTRHHASLHHVYFPRAVYYDRIINYLATDIIAISENVRNILVNWEKTPAAKVQLIHHGFRLNLFQSVAAGQVEALQQRYGTQGCFPVVGVIARQTHWKGIQYIIPAFAELLKHYPQAHLLLANAHGDYQAEIQARLQTLPAESYTQIRFEDNLFALYKLFDLHVHTPIDAHSEAFGQTYVEALAAGVPSVFSLSGVAPEFIVHEKNALVVPFQDSDSVYRAMHRLLNESALRQALINQGRQDVQIHFGLDKMIKSLEMLYQC